MKRGDGASPGRRGVLGRILAPVLLLGCGAAAFISIEGINQTPEVQYAGPATRTVAGHILRLAAMPAGAGLCRLLLTLDGGHELASRARVSFVLSMQDSATMAMGPFVVPARRVGSGRYQAVGSFSMPGRWSVIAAVQAPTLAGGGLRAPFAVTVTS